MRRVTALVLVIALALSGCGAFSKVVHTINDIASDACELFATEHVDQLQGLSPAEFCAVQENLDPFIRHITAAQHTAGSMAVSRGLD